MAATENVRQLTPAHNLLTPHHGVLTLYGYGIQVRVDRGHLFVEDGIGPDRHCARLPRVGHGLKRLVVIGSDGAVSLAALQWLADQNASFLMLERDGSVRATTGPVGPSDARLRRAQSLALSNGVGLRIARELIRRKLVAQEDVARKKLLDSSTADVIAKIAAGLPLADCVSTIRLIESQAARVYWSAWSTLPINFPKRDQSRVPEHWCSFGTRVSPLTHSPRLAINPPNAMLNYLYSLLESEARLAAVAMGLDPGLGVLHADTTARDSLANDLMEPIRPQVDAYLLDWITREFLNRKWFFERSDGNCRLMSCLAVQLSRTAAMWSGAVAPLAEWVAREFWSRPREDSANQGVPTRLTQNRRRIAKGGEAQRSELRIPGRDNLCHECGKAIDRRYTHCRTCRVEGAADRMPNVARIGRLTALTAQAQLKRSETQRRNAIARYTWDASSQAEWLTEQFYSEKIQPLLAQMSGTAIARAIGATCAYGSRVRHGTRPHARHWKALAALVGVMPSVMVRGSTPCV